MRLIEDFKIESLGEYGFQELNDDYKLDNCIDEDHELKYQSGWVWEIGHSRRGQFYYLICDLKSNIRIFASKPDGSGGTVLAPDILSEMIADGIIRGGKND